MLTIKVAEAGIIVGQDITAPLQQLLSKIRDIKQPKTLVFERGEYYLNSKDSVLQKYFITNTIGENQWEQGKKYHIKIGVLLKGQRDLTIQGNGATFVINGQMTNIVIDNCHNTCLNDFSIKTINPNLHEFTVIKKSLFYIDFALDKESRYKVVDNKFLFTGYDYQVNFYKNRKVARWIARMPYDNSDVLQRVAHPFMQAIKIKEITPYTFRVYYALSPNYKVGDRFCIYDDKRYNVGIFVNNSQDITLDKVSQHFNYSLAFVAQNSADISITNSRFSPQKSSSKHMASLADFMQFCMCKGDINVANNYFEGAGDDCLNVHGVNFKVIKIQDNNITLRFMHPQTHGFNAFDIADTIAYIDRQSLTDMGMASVIQSKMLNDYDILLTVDNVLGCMIGGAVENITKTPNLNFSGNYINRIITRGLLVTTRGKVVISNNYFNSTSMHSILFSNDANSWYESGAVKDVTISGNTFNRCVGYNINIKPENRCHKEAVHSNFLIEKNNFNSAPHGGIYIKSAENIAIQGNKMLRVKRKFIKTKDVKNLKSDIE